MPHLIDRIVDGRVLGNVRVALGNIGFRLVVIVVADEILHRVVGEKLFELLIELTGQRLVMDQNQRGLLHLRDHIGHGKGLAGSGDTEQRLVLPASRNPGHQLVDGLALISAGLEWGFELKRRHGTTFRPLSYHRKQHCAQQSAREGRRLKLIRASNDRPSASAEPLPACLGGIDELCGLISWAPGSTDRGSLSVN